MESIQNVALYWSKKETKILKHTAISGGVGEFLITRHKYSYTNKSLQANKARRKLLNYISIVRICIHTNAYDYKQMKWWTKHLKLKWLPRADCNWTPSRCVLGTSGMRIGGVELTKITRQAFATSNEAALIGNWQLFLTRTNPFQVMAHTLGKFVSITPAFGYSGRNSDEKDVELPKYVTPDFWKTVLNLRGNFFRILRRLPKYSQATELPPRGENRSFDRRVRDVITGAFGKKVRRHFYFQFLVILACHKINTITLFTSQCILV